MARANITIDGSMPICMRIQRQCLDFTFKRWIISYICFCTYGTMNDERLNVVEQDPRVVAEWIASHLLPYWHSSRFIVSFHPNIFTSYRNKYNVLRCYILRRWNGWAGLGDNRRGVEWDFEMIGGNLVLLLPFFVLHILQVARFSGNVRRGGRAMGDGWGMGIGETKRREIMNLWMKWCSK